MYKLVLGLHSIGIVHGDLEPRNVARIHGGGFRLIDFSESRRHICKESKVQYVTISLLIAANIGIDWRTADSSSSPKAKVFRTPDIAMFVAETAVPSDPWRKFAVKELSSFRCLHTYLGWYTLTRLCWALLLLSLFIPPRQHQR